MTQLTVDLTLVDEPAGRYAVARDRVRVDDLTTHVPEAIMRVRQWLDERGTPCIEQPREHYLANPGTESDPALYRTRIAWPVA